LGRALPQTPQLDLRELTSKEGDWGKGKRRVEGIEGKRGKGRVRPRDAKLLLNQGPQCLAIM